VQVMTVRVLPTVPSPEEAAVSDGASAEASAGDGAFALFPEAGGIGAGHPLTPIIPLNEKPLTSKKKPDGWRAASTRSDSALKIWKRKKNEKGGAPLLP